MERREVKSYGKNKQLRINLNKNNSFNAGDDVAIIFYKDFLNIDNNIKESDLKIKDDLIAKKQKTINNINLENKRLIKKNNNLIRINSDKESQIQEADEIINDLNNNINDLKFIIESKEDTINENIKKFESKETELNKKLEDKDNEIIRLNKQLKYNTERYNKLEIDLKIANENINHLENTAVLKDKVYNKTVESIILLTEKTIINDFLIAANDKILNTGRLKRFKGFSLSPEDVHADEITSSIKKELNGMKNILKLE